MYRLLCIYASGLFKAWVLCYVGNYFKVCILALIELIDYCWFFYPHLTGLVYAVSI